MPRTRLLPLLVATSALFAACGYPTLEGEQCAQAYPVEDFEVTGDCDAIIGVMWDGAFCSSISGCSCSGPGCGDLFASEEDCERATARCSSAE